MRALALGLVASITGCSCKGETGATSRLAASPAPMAKAPAGGFCTHCSAPTTPGSLFNDAIREASGIVASALHPGLFYVHDDSGGRARFYAIDESGGDKGSFDVLGATNVDWEDAARGPCGETWCLYFGDIGGGKSKERHDVVIYRVHEPAEVGPGPHSVTSEAMRFAYLDGAFDAETLLVHPNTGAITVVTKVKSGSSSIYEAVPPFSSDKITPLAKVGEVAATRGSPRFTGGAVHPAGLGVLLRTYTDVFFYAMQPEQSVGRALSGAPCVLVGPKEEHGEAIAWLPSGDGFVTVSEGENAPVWVAQCATTP